MTKVFRLLTSILIAFGCFFLFWQSLRPVKAAVIAVNPGDSIQAAIDAAASGDTILINAGRYTESLTLNKAVSLTGVSSATTIIHARPNNTVITVTGAAIDQSVVISGLMLTGGVVSDGPTFDSGRAAGLAVENGARPAIQHVHFKDMMGNFGFGMIVDQGDPLTLNHVTFEDNFGGGIFSRSDLTLTHAYLENNFSGIIAINADVDLHDSTFISHLVAISATNVLMENSHMAENDANRVVFFSLHYDGGAYELRTPIDIKWPPYSYPPYILNGLGPVLAVNASVINSIFISNVGSLGGVFRVIDTIHVTNSTFISNQVIGDDYRNGTVDGKGGAIYANQLAKIYSSTFQNNGAVDGANGSAIYSDNKIAIINSTFINQRCDDRDAFFPPILEIPCFDGHVLYGVEIEIFSSNLNENYVGPWGAVVKGRRVDIIESSFSNNIAGLGSVFLDGANVDNTGYGSDGAAFGKIDSSLFFSNTGHFASGIVNYSGTMTISNSLFEANTLSNDVYLGEKPDTVIWADGNLTINHSTFLNNKSVQPTIMVARESLTFLPVLQVNHSKFVHNSTVENRGVIGVYGGSAKLSNSIVQDGPVASAALSLANSFVGSSITESVLIVENTTISNSLPLTVPAFYSGDTIIISNTIVAGFDLMAEGIGVEEDYNIFTNPPDANSGIVISGGHSLYETDPLFVDPAAGDFRLQLSSPAIDAGVDMGLTADFAGNPRPGTGSPLHDIGAFEFQGVGRCGVIDCYIYLPLVINSPENS